ncbi:MAG: V-type ATP synthase subunit E [Victivallales bacterium]|nr:V-type ATP synthase subunit E [Victivallales bacterium]
MPDNHQEDKLRQEILGDAKLNAERIVARAKNEAQKTIDAAQAEVDQKRADRLHEANEEADSKCHSILLDVQRESTRHWLLQREQRIDEMFQEAVRQASELTGEEHEKSLLQLAEEAMAAVGPADMRVIFNSKDTAIITEPWLRAIAAKLFGEKAAQVAFTLEPGDNAPAGIAFATTDGARTFDNSYAARLRNMKDTLRIALS